MTDRMLDRVFADALALVGFAGVAFDHWGGVLVVIIAIFVAAVILPKKPADAAEPQQSEAAE